MNTTGDVVIEAFERHLAALRLVDMRATSDRFACVWGDDLEALKSLDQERVFMFLVKVGPARKSACVGYVEGVLAIRYAVTRASMGPVT